MTTWPTLPTAWSPITKVSASDIALLLDAWEHLGSAWDTDTPALTADTTNPTGWTTWALYKEIGSLLVVQMGFYGKGSGDNGSGDYRLALPNSNTVTGALQDQTLCGGAQTSGTKGVGRVYARFVSSTTVEIEFVDDLGTRTVMSDADFGATPAASQYCVLHGTIEVD